MENKIDYKKSLGQNFLFDRNLLNAIVHDAGVNKEDTVLEIGAGAGTLTRALASNAKRIISFEIDKGLKPYLDEVASEYKNVEINFADFMNVDINSLNIERAKVVANIPYYITTPIIFKLADNIDKFDSITVLIQKEVALRFASKERTKEYGITSVILQAMFDVTIPRIVKKECFTPMPKVDSALCKLVKHNQYNINDFDKFKEFVSKSFGMRRKTLVNNLKTNYDKNVIIQNLINLGYNEMTRPEEISVENFIKIYHLLNF